jgi:predicted phage terminase large subunit-like protein
MCHALEEVRAGAERRLVITVPPRHLKSITTAVAFPAFVLGHDPGAKFIVASYGHDLARKHAEDFRAVIESCWYQALFPATRIAQRGNRTDELRTTSGGQRKAVSIGGAVTGHGADYILVDDLLKASDASSEAELLRAQEYLEGSLISRFNNPREGRVVVIQQRLHEDDPAGYLLSKGTYRHLNLPAIAEVEERIAVGPGRHHLRQVGEALFPARMGLEDLDRLRREMGSATFQMQYQQNPTAAEGSSLRWEWFGTYEALLPRHRYQYVVQSWDTGMSADPRSDPSVCTTWGLHESKWHLLDVLRERLDYPDLRKTALRHADRWGAELVLIEDAASGISLLHDCRREDRARFRGSKPREDKEVRFAAACARVEAGEVLLPREATWLAEFRRELQGFPRARHDDQVDSVSQFVNWLRGTGPARWIPGHETPRRETMRRRETSRRRDGPPYPSSDSGD